MHDNERLKACDMDPNEYHQVVYPLVVLEYFTFMKDMFDDIQVVMRNPEKFYPGKKIEANAEPERISYPLQGQTKLL